MIGRLKKVSVWALALVLLAALAAVPAVYGAGGIDTGKACTIDLRLDGQYPELNGMAVPVKLYRVADVGIDGSYTVVDDLQGLDLSRINSGTTAEEWSTLAQQASSILEGSGSAPAAEIQIQNAVGQAAGLLPGMYLVEAETMQSPEYTYDFIPYLIALPGNYYTDTGDDSWVYDMDSMLKPEQQIRYGSLVIEKLLDTYNATFGGASFVFQVEAVKDGKSVYSDVVSLVFDGPGVRSVQIDHIPAGATVTVTEVYSGSTYKVVSDPTQTATIIAEGDEGDPVSVHFENTYDEHPNGGSSILNHFRYEGGTWSDEDIQRKDSTDQ